MNQYPAIFLTVYGTVLEILPDLGLAHVQTPDGLIYGLNPQTNGLRFDMLQLGQKVRLQVTMKFSRVLHAELLS